MNVPTKLQVLEQYFGYAPSAPARSLLWTGSWRGGDVLAVMPTGAGKSPRPFRA